MANQAWLTLYPTVEVSFMNEGTFDHTPALFTIYPRHDSSKKKNF